MKPTFSMILNTMPAAVKLLGPILYHRNPFRGKAMDNPLFSLEQLVERFGGAAPFANALREQYDQGDEETRARILRAIDRLICLFGD